VVVVVVVVVLLVVVVAPTLTGAVELKAALVLVVVSDETGGLFGKFVLHLPPKLHLSPFTKTKTAKMSKNRILIILCPES